MTLTQEQFKRLEENNKMFEAWINRPVPKVTKVRRPEGTFTHYKN